MRFDNRLGDLVLLTLLVVLTVLALVAPGDAPSNWVVLAFIVAAWLELRQPGPGRRRL